MIDTCYRCRAERGWIEILAPDQFNHATVARCPHDDTELMRITHDAEDVRVVAATARHRPSMESRSQA